MKSFTVTLWLTMLYASSLFAQAEFPDTLTSEQLYQIAEEAIENKGQLFGAM